MPLNRPGAKGGNKTKLPCLMSNFVPGKGKPVKAGLKGPRPGKELIKMPPVSVCHQVSTIGHLSLPIFLKYHNQAASSIGSPTEPNNLNCLNWYFPTRGV